MRGHSWGQIVHFLPREQVGMETNAGQRLLLHTRWCDSGVAFTLQPIVSNARPTRVTAAVALEQTLQRTPLPRRLESEFAETQVGEESA